MGFKEDELVLCIKKRPPENPENWGYWIRMPLESPLKVSVDYMSRDYPFHEHATQMEVLESIQKILELAFGEE